MGTVFCVIGIVYSLTFLFDIINSFFTDDGFSDIGIKRIKLTLEPFISFFVLIYKRFIKKERKIVVG